MTSREQIEKIKNDFQAKLAKNSPRYRRAIIRELDFLYRQHGKGDLQSFREVVERLFDIPATEKALTFKAFTQAQEEIAKLWDEFFLESTDLFDGADPNNFEKLQALYKVDFSKIKSEAGAIITEEIRRTARAGKGYEVLRSRLLRRSLGEAQARTLANTALAQFDNGVMFEFAQQGGVEKFKYDGVLHTNTRPFCREHLGKKYTIDQIRRMDNGQGIPVETSCGGYNCTHFWTPVIPELTAKSKRTKKAVASNTAAGIPVSSAFDVKVRGDVKRSVDRGISFIDQVHGDGRLKVLPVEGLTSRSVAGGFGTNRYTHEAINILINGASDHIELTTIHEIGHYLDHSGIGVAKEMSSMNDAIMNSWKETVKNSQAYKNLEQIIQRRYIEIPSVDGVYRTWNRQIEDHFRYLLSDEELWARSYAQFITSKTNDETLKKQVAKILQDKIEGNKHWTEEDFKPIGMEIEKLFTQLGWMV